MAIPFDLVQGVAFFHAEFHRPSFDLFVGPKLLEEVLARLSEPYGARVASFKVDTADGAIGRANVSCSLLDFSVTLRVTVERLEIETYQFERLGAEQFAKAAVDAAQAVIAARGGDPFVTYTVDVGLHGRLQGMEVPSFLTRFLAVPPKHRGGLVSSGCTFYFGPSAEMLSSSVTVDPSAAVKGALFMRSRTVWDASRASLEALPELARAEFRAALALLDLTMEGNA